VASATKTATKTVSDPTSAGAAAAKTTTSGVSAR
jgi:hypothetical protein